MSEPDGNIDVCVDCYFAHHYGATKIERSATEQESTYWFNSYDLRSLMGCEFTETPEGLMVTEWFSGESDQRCEGGEPLSRCEGLELADDTCADHDVEGHPCEHCGREDYEDGLTSFTWSACQGCGCHLGGSRHRLAYWIKEPA